MIPKTHILALHGFMGSGLDFNPIIKKLDSNIHWITPNLPGHGPNPKIPHTHYSFNDTIHELHSITHNYPKINLLGYSMGARIALLYALKYISQINSLILISPNPGISDLNERKQRKQWDDSTADSILNQPLQQFIHHWQNNPLIQTQKNIPKEIYNSLLENRCLSNPQGLSLSIRSLGTGSMPSQWESLHQITCSTFLITGEKDTHYESIARSIKEKIPHASHYSIPDAGHAPHLENLAYYTSLMELIIDL